MSSTPISTKVEPAKRDLVRRLLRMLFAGELFPGRLVEADLAAQFGVSRTPVREALMELAGVGLVELKPNCGAVLRTFGPRQIREIYQVREVLESEAARLAAGRLPRMLIEDLTNESLDLLGRTIRTEQWSEKVWVADRAMHENIAEHCGNRRLAEEIGRYANFMQVIRETVGNRDRAQDAAIREHLEVLKALAAGNGNAAAKAMRSHLHNTGDAAVQAIAPHFPKEVRSSVAV